MVYQVLTLRAHASCRSSQHDLPGSSDKKPEHSMYAQKERSCWGPAKWTLAAFFGVAALVYLLGGMETGKRPVAQQASAAATAVK
jgi:hypothetical protein